MFRFTSCPLWILVQRSNFKEKNRKFLMNWIEINNIKWMFNLIRLWLRKLKGKITSFTMRFKCFHYDNILIQIFRRILHFWRFIVPNLEPYFSRHVNICTMYWSTYISINPKLQNIYCNGFSLKMIVFKSLQIFNQCSYSNYEGMLILRRHQCG